jgi:Protein of unknown function, DUF624
VASKADAINVRRSTIDDRPPKSDSDGGPSSVVGRRAAGPLRLAFTRAVQDWWYGLIPLALLNLIWLILVVTVVAGPPATAAMLLVARDAAVGEGAEPRNFFIYIRRTFWRAWAFGLFTLLVTVILVTDIGFYGSIFSGNTFLLNMGMWFLVYVLLVWLQFLLIAWPLLVDQPDMRLRDVARNAAIVTLRYPGANLGLALIVVFLFVISFFLAIGLSLAYAALMALLVQHYLHIQVPVLANFPVLGEGDDERAEDDSENVKRKT